MNNIELKIPDGYFEKSFERTIAGVSAIRRRRTVVFGMIAAIVLAFCITFTSIKVHNVRQEKFYLAQQEELANLDIFLEIN
jgi:hypothetical protein